MTPDRATLLAEVSRFPIFRGLSGEALQRLLERARYVELETGEVLWDAGTRATALALVTDGWIELSRPARSGNQTVVGLFGPGDLLGMAARLRGGNYPNNATAASPRTRVLRIPFDPSNPEFRDWSSTCVLRFEQLLNLTVDALTAPGVEERLIELTLQLCDRFGSAYRSTGIRVPLGLTRAQASRLLHCRVESVIRVLSAWGRNDLAVWNKHEIIVPNPGKLERTAGYRSK